MAASSHHMDGLIVVASSDSYHEKGRPFGTGHKAWLYLGSLIAASGLALQGSKIDRSECCGIVGVVGTQEQDAREYLLEGLMILKNRGYDSAGLATMPGTGGKMTITKFASVGEKADSIQLVKAHSHTSEGHCVGIAHTRWATHGGKTDENAHPHTDSSGKIALVHNGTINNANELRRELQAEGHIFTSQTDTEVIAKLIGKYYHEDKLNLKDATEKSLSRCEGTWGLCIMCTDAPEELVVACNGSPLVIGIGTDRTFVASETTAFNRYTKNFISLKDGEIGVLHADGRTLDLTRKQRAPDQLVKLSPDPYPDWTIKEIVEQPEALARALGFGGRLGSDGVHLGGLDGNRSRLETIDHMLLSACGTSLHAAKYGVRLMKHLKSFDSVQALDAAETGLVDFPQRHLEKSGVIVISQSGETKDVVRVVNLAMERGLSVLSVVNAVGSLIARTTQMGVYCHAGRENAVGSTKAFTTQVTVMALIAIWFRLARDRVRGISRVPNSVAQLHDALMRLPINFGMVLHTRGHCKGIAEKLKDKEHCFVLGKGFAEPVALEGALKIKELGYLHAEGYSGGALKHGPFALIEDNENGKFGATPIIMIILDDENKHHMRTAAEEVRARGAEIFIITDKPELVSDLDPNPIVIPSNGPLTALGAVLPLQLIAYELSKLRGIPVDTPRNLAKAVTVD